jgi:hypothetical protein
MGGRGNPAVAHHSVHNFTPCHCEERKRHGNPAEPLGIPPHRPGIPHNDPDWIATSVLFETFLAMTR